MTFNKHLFVKALIVSGFAFFLNTAHLRASAAQKATPDPRRCLLLEPSQKIMERFNLERVFHGIAPNLTLKSFAKQWRRTVVSNGESVEPRPLEDILDMNEYGSPLKLIAVTFRPDMPTPSSPDGEGRLIYQLIPNPNGSAQGFFVILEFGLPTSGNIRWKKRIRDLCDLEDGLEREAEILSLISGFASKESNAILHSARTSDQYFGAKWEWRDFKLHFKSSKSWLEMVPVPDTPHSKFLEHPSMDLHREVTSNEREILAGTYKLPVRFLGGAVHADHEDFSWTRALNLKPEVGRAFSMRTCSGCHSGDTQTRFTHISKTGDSDPLEISDFLRTELKERLVDLETSRRRPRYIH